VPAEVPSGGNRNRRLRTVTVKKDQEKSMAEREKHLSGKVKERTLKQETRRRDSLGTFRPKKRGEVSLLWGKPFPYHQKRPPKTNRIEQKRGKRKRVQSKENMETQRGIAHSKDLVKKKTREKALPEVTVVSMKGQAR